MEPAYKPGERIIYGSLHIETDGLRGVVLAAHPGGYYDIRFDDGQEWQGVWESKLYREADHPTYPLPCAPPSSTL